MIDLNRLAIETLAEEVERHYAEDYGLQSPEYPRIASWAVRTALSIIANTDALYHNVDHTAKVVLVGQEILRGKQQIDGGVSASDWLHFTVALACHDIGYVRGLCSRDGQGVYATGVGDEIVELGRGVTDAALTPYHVDRGVHFVLNRFAGTPVLDAARIAELIERTRFPVPSDDDHSGTDDYPGLLRGADLIGQMADPQYLQKLAALFYEFEETGVNAKLDYHSPDDLRDGYPRFFWNAVHPFLGPSLKYLQATPGGRDWVNNLYSHVFAVEHALHLR
ncbi:MAG: metal-dependent phosphohydrolase [Gammaproteobacteria bacterium]